MPRLQTIESFKYTLTILYSLMLHNDCALFILLKI
uniref:Uncharacterized protein n=1 Tax=Anguilla anguilla TaxID=7936 RepID=A0A0E9T582_ANGAN